MRHIFEKIYRNGFWFGGSGSGSFPSNTIIYRDFLQKYLAKNEIRRVVDIGCGDWRSSCLVDWSGIEYLGIDVVPFIVEENRRKYGGPGITFECADVRKLQLFSADLIILKDVLQHWSNDEIIGFLVKLVSYQHILAIDTCDGERLNDDIKNGEWRPINLGLPPFNCRVEEVLRYESYRPHKKIHEIKSVKKLILS